LPVQNSSSYRLPSAILWIIILGFALHFFSVLGYQFGNEVLPKKLNTIIDRYSVPWFYQNYYMFAPDPTYHINSFVFRVETEDGWTDWQEPGLDQLRQHWQNRFGNASDLYDMFYGLSNALYDGIIFIHFMEDPSVEDWFSLPAHNAAERYITLNSTFAGEGILAYQVGVKTEYHFFDDRKHLKTQSIFQKYPVKSIKP